MRPAHSQPCARPSRALLLLALLGLAVPLAAPATTPLPFTDGQRQRIEETFFDPQGRLSPSKVAAYREQIEERQRETFAILTSHYVRRETPSRARSRAATKKVSRLFIALGAPRGWIAKLEQSEDPVEQRRIAAHLIEFDRALRVSGKRPHSLEVIDYLIWLTSKPWDIPTRSHPRDADREAKNLLDPKSGEFYEADELRQLIEAGEDLSRLSPPEDSTFWNDPGAVARRRPIATYLQGDSRSSGTCASASPIA